MTLPSSSSRPRRVLVVGAGIAGSAAAITLTEAGLDVTVIEKQDAWRFQSSGIFVYSNGLRALREVGVLPGILEAGYVIRDGRNITLDHTGEHIVDTFYPAPGVPAILGIKRAEMHRVLARRIEELGVPVRLGTTIAELDDGPERVAVTFSDGSAGEYDLVVGADGIRSQVRDFIFPEVTPRYTGFGVWRSVHDRPRDLTDKYMLMGMGKRLGIMPISDDKLYIFGTVLEPAGHWYERSDWPALMRAKFAEFAGPVAPLLAEVSDRTEVLYTAVEEIAMPTPWHRGRVLLIGDAAHASTPFMGQGGAMAVEDAVVLARMLREADDLGAVLRAFGERRYPMCKFVQDVSRQVGEAGAMEDEEACLRRNAAMKENAQAQVDSFYGRLELLLAEQSRN
jgi:2-polyprenyl-6-methoxyphenol hydroxylase-like FAD-dependent oxidoreductase